MTETDYSKNLLLKLRDRHEFFAAKKGYTDSLKFIYIVSTFIFALTSNYFNTLLDVFEMKGTVYQFVTNYWFSRVLFAIICSTVVTGMILSINSIIGITEDLSDLIENNYDFWFIKSIKSVCHFFEVLIGVLMTPLFFLIIGVFGLHVIWVAFSAQQMKLLLEFSGNLLIILLFTSPFLLITGYLPEKFWKLCTGVNKTKNSDRSGLEQRYYEKIKAEKCILTLDEILRENVKKAINYLKDFELEAFFRSIVILIASSIALSALKIFEFTIMIIDRLKFLKILATLLSIVHKVISKSNHYISSISLGTLFYTISCLLTALSVFSIYIYVRNPQLN